MADDVQVADPTDPTETEETEGSVMAGAFEEAVGGATAAADAKPEDKPAEDDAKPDEDPGAADDKPAEEKPTEDDAKPDYKPAEEKPAEDDAKPEEDPVADAAKSEDKPAEETASQRAEKMIATLGKPAADAAKSEDKPAEDPKPADKPDAVEAALAEQKAAHDAEMAAMQQKLDTAKAEKEPELTVQSIIDGMEDGDDKEDIQRILTDRPEDAKLLNLLTKAILAAKAPGATPDVEDIRKATQATQARINAYEWRAAVTEKHTDFVKINDSKEFLDWGQKAGKKYFDMYVKAHQQAQAQGDHLGDVEAAVLVMDCYKEHVASLSKDKADDKKRTQRAKKQAIHSNTNRGGAPPTEPVGGADDLKSGFEDGTKLED